jgi:hypothetical protein
MPQPLELRCRNRRSRVEGGAALTNRLRWTKGKGRPKETEIFPCDGRKEKAGYFIWGGSQKESDGIGARYLERCSPFGRRCPFLDVGSSVFFGITTLRKPLAVLALRSFLVMLFLSKLVERSKFLWEHDKMAPWAKPAIWQALTTAIPRIGRKYQIYVVLYICIYDTC